MPASPLSATAFKVCKTRHAWTSMTSLRSSTTCGGLLFWMFESRGASAMRKPPCSEKHLSSSPSRTPNFCDLGFPFWLCPLFLAYFVWGCLVFGLPWLVSQLLSRSVKVRKYDLDGNRKLTRDELPPLLAESCLIIVSHT